MTQNRLGAFRIALFVFGLFVVVMALLLLIPYGPDRSAVALFTTVDAVLLYVILLAPLLMGTEIMRLTGRRAVSLGIMWRAVVPYAVLTLVLVLLANCMDQPPLRLFMVLQLAAVFALALAVYFGQAAEAHIEDVRHHETAVHSSVERLRATSERVVVTASHLDSAGIPDYDELMGDLERIAEELRYTTPVHTPEAAYVEDQIAERLDWLEGCMRGGDFGLVQARNARNVTQDVLLLIEHRRILRN